MIIPRRRIVRENKEAPVFPEYNHGDVCLRADCHGYFTVKAKESYEDNGKQICEERMMSTIRKRKAENDLGQGEIRGLVLKLAVPAMLAQMVNVLYSIVDRIYIGNIPDTGAKALAGLGVCGPVVTLISAFAAWIGVGGAPLVSISLGQKDEKKARQILANAFMMLLVMAGLIMGLGYLFKDVLLMKFGATEEIFPFAQEYMKVYLLGTVFSILSLGLNQYIICQGFARQGMFSVIIGAVFNIALDPLFIFVFDMGVQGAAAATVISQLASCCFTLAILFGRRIPVRISFSGYNFSICRRILTLGFTPFMIILFDNVLIIVQNVMLKMYGGNDSELLLTCNTIVQSFMLIVTMPLSGITGGTQAVLGYNYGAGNKTRVKKAEAEIIKTGIIFCTLMFLFARFGAGYFVMLFTRDPYYTAKTIEFIKIYTLGIIPLAVQYAVVDAFTAMGIAKAALPLSFFRKGIYIALVVYLSMNLGAELLFWAEPVSDMISPVVSLCTLAVVFPKLFGNQHLGESGES